MIELAFLAIVAAFVGWLMRRKRQHRSTATTAGEPVGLPCMLKRPAQGSRWKAGRLLIDGAGPLAWEAAWGRRTTVLPTGLRQTGLRPPSPREAMAVNPRSAIVECESPEGQVLIAVMPEELDAATKALATG
ncbi:EGFR-like transmembrane domain-containing protein [Streptomyces parvulus]|uniref:EGFR-like transmembrane domain-containing protein n=1 Tax=Streptomyces parvulus TaxID=146923 RepID=UPI0009A0AE1D|nr:transmembrane domain-containing protein [Streptomyces parvulus]GGR95623.1 hypothetical protein GCM10010220_55040 [Streptomyces parvulus]